MESQERIVIESFEMFVKYGIKSVTMDDIAKNMGISKKTIYENFRDKNDLLEKGLIYHKQKQELDIKTIMATSKNVLESIYKVMFETVSNMQRVNPSFFSDLKKYHHKLCNDFLPNHEKEQNEKIIELFEKGVSDGIFREDINLMIAAANLNYQLKAVTDEDVFPPDQFAVSEVFRTIIEIFSRGMATPKGIKIIEKIIEDKEKETK